MSAITGGNVKISQLTGLDTISNGAKLRIPASIDNSATSTPNWVSYSVNGEVLSYFIKNNIGINNLESELERQNGLISDLRHDVSSNDTIITNLGIDLSTLRGDVNTNSGKISTLENGFNTQNDQITTLKTYVGDQNTQISALEGNLSTLQSDVAKNSRRITSLEQAQGGGSGGSGDFVTSTELTEVDTRLTGEINSVKGDLQSYSGQIQQNSYDINNLKIIVDNSYKKITSNSDNISTLRSDVDTHSSQISGLNVQISTLQSDVAANSRRISDINTTIEAQGNNISTLQSDVAAHSEKIADLESAQTGNNNALLRDEVGYFSGELNLSENIYPQLVTPTDKSGQIMFYSKIYTSVEGLFAGFVYKLGTDYYLAVPDGFPYRMPSKTGIAINLSDGCAYVVSAEGKLKKFIPEATNSSAGLLSVNDKNKLDDYATTFSENPTATNSSAGLLSKDDKNKLDACVTTEATTSAAGLMSSAHVITLNNTLSRMEVGYFSDTVILSENERISPSIMMPSSIFGEIVFCNRIFSSGSLYAGFVYRLENSYYITVPNGFRYRMPSRTGIAINLSDGCAYVINVNELKEFIPVGTTGLPGLMPTSVLTRLDEIENRLAALER